MTRVIYLAFLLSGAAGLIYETTWTRYLALLLGHSAHSQTIVLVVFLGGMALGALATARVSKQLRRPWLGYVGVEAIIGALGIGFHAIYTGVASLAYDHMFPAVGSGIALVLAKWAIAAALILPQSVLLGATFPLLSAQALRIRPQSPGRVLALLYSINGIGGAAGVLVGGFWLMERAGLPGSLAVAGGLNFAAAILVALSGFARRGTSPTVVATVPVDPVAESLATQPATDGRLRAALLAVAFGTAAASFLYEIAWTRMLSLVLGSATHSFELMLSAFILGLSLGALWIHRRIDGITNARRALGIVQWVMGGLAMATMPLYLASFQWTAGLLGALDVTAEGYALFSVGRYAIALAIMLPATFCAGITLPLITRMLLVSGDGERAVGMAYGANTLGSIVGVTVAALVLMPLIGLKALLMVGAIIDMGIGVWLLAGPEPLVQRRRQVTAAMAAATVLVCAAIGATTHFDRELLTTGVFRSRRLPDGSRSIVYYRDGRTATVSAAVENRTALLLSTNGKVDASVPREWISPVPGGNRVLTGDVGTQVLLALFTLAHAPDAREGAVIGHGSGMSSHFLLASSSLTELTTIEIEPAMIEGSDAFYPANRRVFDDPRSRFIIDDARSYFAGSGKTFDLILSEPSNPWVSGVSGLFTTEFYASVAQHLSERGVFGQWIHLYESNDALLLGILAALHENFASYAIYATAPYDVIVVAGNQPVLPTPDWGVVRSDGTAADLAGVLPLTSQTLTALRLADRATFAPLLDAGTVAANSDFRPILDLGAERARYLGTYARGLAGLGLPRFDALAALDGRMTELGTDGWTAVPDKDAASASALSARLRADIPEQLDTLPRDAPLKAALYRKHMVERMMAGNAPPPDWQLWFRSVVQVEAELHGPADGVADERFYGALDRYLVRAKAPPAALAAQRFMHALAVWDWPAAARAAEPLLLAARFGEGWVPELMLRDGATVARIKTGDTAGATKVFNGLSPVAGGATDLRSVLIAAHIKLAENSNDSMVAARR